MDMEISGETLRYAISVEEGFHPNRQEGVVTGIYVSQKWKGSIVIMILWVPTLKEDFR